MPKNFEFDGSFPPYFLLGFFLKKLVAFGDFFVLKIDTG